MLKSGPHQQGWHQHNPLGWSDGQMVTYQPPWVGRWSDINAGPEVGLIPLCLLDPPQHPKIQDTQRSKLAPTSMSYTGLQRHDTRRQAGRFPQTSRLHGFHMIRLACRHAPSTINCSEITLRDSHADMLLQPSPHSQRWPAITGARRVTHCRCPE